MLIFWGTKEIKKKIGFVTDFCTTCSKIEAFIIHKHSLRSHIYYLPFGKHKEEHHIKCCQRCGSISLSELSIYSSIINTRKLKLTTNELISKTFPNIKEFYRERLELESKISKGPNAVGLKNWHFLLREPFEIFEEKVRLFNSQSQLDFIAVTFILIALSLPIATAIILEDYTFSFEFKTGLVISSFIVGMILAVVQYIGVTKRYILRKLYPELARTLLKFNNYQYEIKQVFEALKSEGYKITIKGDYQALFNQIQKINQSNRI